MQRGLNSTSNDGDGGSDWVLDSLLGGKSKQGVFTADFLDENGTTVTVRDGDSTLLNCNVYLRHDKTVRLNNAITKGCPQHCSVYFSSDTMQYGTLQF